MWKILNVTHEEWMGRHIKFSTAFLYKTKEVARIMLDCEIVAFWRTIFLDFTCSLDIMEEVISKKLLSYTLYQIYWFFQLAILVKYFTYKSSKLLITKFKYSNFCCTKLRRLTYAKWKEKHITTKEWCSV